MDKCKELYEKYKDKSYDDMPIYIDIDNDFYFPVYDSKEWTVIDFIKNGKTYPGIIQCQNCGAFFDGFSDQSICDNCSWDLIKH